MRNILVYGLGQSGKAVGRLFEGENVLYYDDFVSGEGVLTLGEAKEFAAKTDLMVVSPAVPSNSPLCVFYREKGVPVVGEFELAVRRTRAKIAAVTGTNGKTSVCQLISQGLNFGGIEHVLAGNIGVPFSEHCDKLTENGLAVLEASSFQLETFHGFRPFVAAVTNITPDHLDRHKSMEGYIKAKQNICLWQNRNQFAVLNGDDPVTRRYIKSGGRPLYFGGERGFFCFAEGDKIFCDGSEIDISAITGKTKGFVSNMLCAASVLTVLGVGAKQIEEAFGLFRRDRHRVEHVGTIAGVDFFDDSKATNVAAACDSVNSFQNVCVILGGSDKGYDFGEFFEKAKPKYACAFGQTKDKIFAAAQRNGFYNIDVADDLMSATMNCYRQALVEGGVVLLAPACASFDMFRDYKERGDKFVEIVKDIVSKKRL